MTNFFHHIQYSVKAIDHHYLFIDLTFCWYLIYLLLCIYSYYQSCYYKSTFYQFYHSLLLTFLLTSCSYFVHLLLLFTFHLFHSVNNVLFLLYFIVVTSRTQKSTTTTNYISCWCLCISIGVFYEMVSVRWLANILVEKMNSEFSLMVLLSRIFVALWFKITVCEKVSIKNIQIRTITNIYYNSYF